MISIPIRDFQLNCPTAHRGAHAGHLRTDVISKLSDSRLWNARNMSTINPSIVILGQVPFTLL